MQTNWWKQGMGLYKICYYMIQVYKRISYLRAILYKLIITPFQTHLTIHMLIFTREQLFKRYRILKKWNLQFICKPRLFIVMEAACLVIERQIFAISVKGSRKALSRNDVGWAEARESMKITDRCVQWKKFMRTEARESGINCYILCSLFDRIIIYFFYSFISLSTS